MPTSEKKTVRFCELEGIAELEEEKEAGQSQSSQSQPDSTEAVEGGSEPRADPSPVANGHQNALSPADSQEVTQPQGVEPSDTSELRPGCTSQSQPIAQIEPTQADLNREVSEKPAADLVNKDRCQLFGAKSEGKNSNDVLDLSEVGSYFVTSRNFYEDSGIVFRKSPTTQRLLYAKSTVKGSPSPRLLKTPVSSEKTRWAELPSERNWSGHVESSQALRQDSLTRQEFGTHSTGGSMSYGGREVVAVTTYSRLQEKEDLQHLHDRLAAYVSKVRQVAEANSQVDSSAFLKSAKLLEDEINNLKTLYERELENLRRELEELKKEKNSVQLHSHKTQEMVSELEGRLAIETDKSRSATQELTTLQQRLVAVEAELTAVRQTSGSASDTVPLQRHVENLTRELETWKHRYEHEQLMRQELDDKLQQAHKKYTFSDQVQAQQMRDLQERLNSANATILSLEAKVREIGRSDSNFADILRQVRESSEAELRKFQMESQEQTSRTIASLKVQMERDAQTIATLTEEKSSVLGEITELRTKTRTLEGEISSLTHQRACLEDAVGSERTRAADTIQTLEQKLREVQELLFEKIREVTNARDANIPLKAEIEALKALLEEEERRLRCPMPEQLLSPGAASSSLVQTFNLTSNAAATSNPAPNPPPDPAPKLRRPNSAPRPAPTSASVPATSLPLTAPPTSYSFAPSSTSPRLNDSLPLATTYGVDYPSPLDPYYPSEYRAGLSQFDPIASTHVTSMFLDGQDVTMAPLTTPDLPSSRYLYESSPSANRVYVEPTPPSTPRAVGPIRAKSAPATGSASRNLPLIPSSLGQGRDYFEEMFNDLKRDTIYSSMRPQTTQGERPSLATHDYTVATNRHFVSSAIGDIKILEVHRDGKFVRLFNDGAAEMEFGGYMIQQNVGGHPVAVFRFPPRTKFPGSSTITVWSGSNDLLLHNPPTDFVWKEQQKWGTGPECTTILCRPNGQAIAWTTAAHRFGRNTFEEKDTELGNPAGPNDSLDDMDENLTEWVSDMYANKSENVCLRREKQPAPTLVPQRHPHGESPANPCHPHTGQARPHTYGNDNGSHNRQSRSQTMRPDPISGQPYAGPQHQKFGHATTVKKVKPQPQTLRGNGSIANKAAGTIRFGPPSPFLSPLQQEFCAASEKGSTSLVRFTA